jgi:hypothetical protein
MIGANGDFECNGDCTTLRFSFAKIREFTVNGVPGLTFFRAAKHSARIVQQRRARIPSEKESISWHGK